jgi:hypothetical protein
MKFPGTNSHFSGRRERFVAYPGKAPDAATEFGHYIKKINASPFLLDFETIQACNEADPKVAMMFTGQRSFKH